MSLERALQDRLPGCTARGQLQSGTLVSPFCDGVTAAAAALLPWAKEVTQREASQLLKSAVALAGFRIIVLISYS